jgi:hypothetical protein
MFGIPSEKHVGRKLRLPGVWGGLLQEIGHLNRKDKKL